MSTDPAIIDRAMRKIRREQGLPEKPESIPLERNLIRPDEFAPKVEPAPGVPLEPRWSNPSSWTLSMKFSPAAVVALGCFIAIYYQHFFGEKGLDMTSWKSCIATFDSGVPVRALTSSLGALPSHSWEFGTAAEALLEFMHPEKAVFSSQAFPDDQIPPNLWWKVLDEDLAWIKPYIRHDGPTLFDDPTSVAGPASLGISAVMLGQRWPMYLDPVQRQRDYLLKNASRYNNGAISHRTDGPELSSAAISMVPPFLAYYAVATRDLDLMREAVEQIRLYHDVLAYEDTPRKHLWRHAVGASSRADAGAWSTGNALAAYGMARVRATITRWGPSNASLITQRNDLDQWIYDLLGAVVKWDTDETALLRNYIDDKSWFGELSGTALMAATAYRMAVLRPDLFGSHLTWAHRKRQAVLERVNAEGIAAPAFNPLQHGSRKPVNESAEGQAYVMTMISAWRDCVCAGVCSSNITQRFDARGLGFSAKSEL